MRRWPCMTLLLGVLAFGLLNLADEVSSLETFRALPAGDQRPAPAFTLQDQDGAPVHLQDFQGKVVVVRFWVTW